MPRAFGRGHGELQIVTQSRMLASPAPQMGRHREAGSPALRVVWTARLQLLFERLMSIWTRPSRFAHAIPVEPAGVAGDLVAPILTAPSANAGAAWPSGKVDGGLVYAIGDIHGCYAELRRLLTQIAGDAAATAGDRTTTLIFCGDYVDRGPASRQVIEALCWLKRRCGSHVRFLKGNHEQVLLDYIEDPAHRTEWLRFGGAETLRSYAVDPPRADDPSSAHLAARDQLLERLPVAHLRFLNALELTVTIGDYAFVHAGVRPGVALAQQRHQDLLWIRDDFLDSDMLHERIIVHGHTWESAQPEVRSNRVGIDTGAYETGVLTAVRIQDGAMSQLSTPEKPS